MVTFDMLPKEITLEIFSRVPAESVLECKLVSRRWKNLLQHSSFPLMHLNRLNDIDAAHDSGNLSLIFYTKWLDKEPFYYTEYDEKLNCFTGTTRINVRPPFEYYDILNSCNGLVCFSASLGNCHNMQPAYICNPITREYIVIPKFEGKDFLAGFGYSPSTNEYKVVRISKDKGDPNFGIVQVYTLGSGIGWRNGRRMDYDVMCFRQLGMFANGAIHWSYYTGTIVAFDLVNEEFRELPSVDEKLKELPLPPWWEDAMSELRVVSNFVCMFYHYSDSEGSESFDLWVLKRNESNLHEIWSREFSNCYGRPISFTKSGGLLCYDLRDNNVYRFAPKASSSSRVLVNFDKKFTVGVPHRNTLVSLKALEEENTKLLNSDERARYSRGQEAAIISQRNRRKKMIS